MVQSRSVWYSLKLVRTVYIQGIVDKVFYVLVVQVGTVYLAVQVGRWYILVHLFCCSRLV